MFIVTLPPSAASDPLAYAKKAQEAGADILEIRGDITPDISNFNSPLPLLIAPRGTGLKLIEQLHPQYIDLEIGEELEIPEDAILIRSFHDYDLTPSLDDLKDIADRLLSLYPDIIKIATFINSFADLRTLEQLHDHLPPDQKRIILGMGPKAHLNRMLSPMKNEMTYTCLNDNEVAAPGQIPISMYKLLPDNKQKHPPLQGAKRVTGEGLGGRRLFGIIGGLEIKTKSPLIHNTLFRKHDVQALYTAFLTDDSDDAWNYIKEINVQGLSVTAPYKLDIINKIDTLDASAEEIGSVNTVIKKNDKYIGYNTDTIGLQKGYDFWNDVQSVAILGSGGVTPAIIHACKAKGVDDIRIFAIDESSRTSLANKWNITASPLEKINDWNPNLIINAISADVDIMLPAHSPDTRSSSEGCSQLTALHVLDLKYGKTSKFLTKAKELGYQTHNGSMMLIHQALAQFELFTGITPAKEDANLLINLIT